MAPVETDALYLTARIKNQTRGTVPNMCEGLHLLLQLGHADIHGRRTSLSQPLHIISKPPSHRLLRDGFDFGSTGLTVLNMAMAASEAAALRSSVNK